MSHPKTQFIRSQAYSSKGIQQVLDEANREEHARSHVPNWKPPYWYKGSKKEIEEAIERYMGGTQKVKLKNGELRERKIRKDHRCLTAGFFSYPESHSSFDREAPDHAERIRKLKDWFSKTNEWLQNQYGDALVGVCYHEDESHPHFHFFVVGDAQRLHPGLRNELLDGKRIEDPERRMKAHKAGLVAWLDDYFQSVCKDLGMLREIGSRPAWRMKDRQIRKRLFDIDKKLEGQPNEQIKVERDAIWDRAEKVPRPKTPF